MGCAMMIVGVTMRVLIGWELVFKYSGGVGLEVECDSVPKCCMIPGALLTQEYPLQKRGLHTAKPWTQTQRKQELFGSDDISSSDGWLIQ